MGLQEFDFASGKVLDAKRKQAIMALESDADEAVATEVLRKLSYKNLGRETELRAVLESVRKHKVGVLLLDADLPGITLNELLPSIKKAFPDFNIIAMSSTVTKESLSETLRLGAVGFLVKPLQEDALTKVMAKLK